MTARVQWVLLNRLKPRLIGNETKTTIMLCSLHNLLNEFKYKIFTKI